jgi:hypothetical protein
MSLRLISLLILVFLVEITILAVVQSKRSLIPLNFQDAISNLNHLEPLKASLRAMYSNRSSFDNFDLLKFDLLMSENVLSQHELANVSRGCSEELALFVNGLKNRESWAFEGISYFLLINRG